MLLYKRYPHRQRYYLVINHILYSYLKDPILNDVMGYQHQDTLYHIVAWLEVVV